MITFLVHRWYLTDVLVLCLMCTYVFVVSLSVRPVHFSVFPKRAVASAAGIVCFHEERECYNWILPNRKNFFYRTCSSHELKLFSWCRQCWRRRHVNKFVLIVAQHNIRPERSNLEMPGIVLHVHLHWMLHIRHVEIWQMCRDETTFVTCQVLPVASFLFIRLQFICCGQLCRLIVCLHTYQQVSAAFLKALSCFLVSTGIDTEHSFSCLTCPFCYFSMQSDWLGHERLCNKGV